MAVELVPNCNHCHQMGVANGTFFEMVNCSGMADIIGRQNTNDPISVSNDESLKCKRILAGWTPPPEWGAGLKPQKMKDYFLEFFSRCDGFTTR